MNLYTSSQSALVGRIDQAIRQLSQIHPLDDAYYAQCLEVFEANSDQRRELLSWLEANVVSNMSQAANAILSVGCGTGAFDTQHHLSERF